MRNDPLSTRSFAARELRYLFFQHRWSTGQAYGVSLPLRFDAGRFARTQLDRRRKNYVCHLTGSVKMKKTGLSRRDFNRFSAAAFGGVMAGTLAGCGGGADTGGGDAGGGDGDAGGGGADAGGGDGGTEVATQEIHVCAGLNSCKGNGGGGTNDCSGQGACSTAVAHTCHQANDCKSQGGCGETAGANDCKGSGECAVPLKRPSETWDKARARFEGKMTADGKEFGDAPAAAEG